MFYGIILQPNKESRIEQNGTGLVHISNVAISTKSTEATSLYLKKDNKSYLLATLDPTKTPQITLDLNVLSEENVHLLSTKSELHLTGYYEPMEENGLPVAEAQNGHAKAHQQVKKTSSQVHEEDLKDHEVKPKGPVKQEESKAVVKTVVASIAKPVQAQVQAKQPVKQEQAKKQPAKKEESESEDELDDEDLEDLDDEDLDDLDDEDLDDLDDEDEEEPVTAKGKVAAPVKAKAAKIEQEGDEDLDELDDEDLEDLEDLDEDDEELEEGDDLIDDEADSEDDEEEAPLRKRADGPAKNFKNEGFKGKQGGFNKGGDKEGFQKGGFNKGGDREGGYKGGNKEGGFQKSNGGFKNDRQGGFNKGGFNKGGREGGYKGGDKGGYKGGDKGGYKGGDKGGFKGGNKGGYKGGDKGGFKGKGGQKNFNRR